MGQKIRPDSLRLGIIRDWRSRWWPKKNFKSHLEEDVLIRNTIKEKMSPAGIVDIIIERTADNAVRISLKAARPGLVIGRGGKGIDELVKLLEKRLKALNTARGAKNQPIAVSLNVEELRRSEIAAQYIAQSIAWDLEKRLPSRRVMKKYLESMMQNREVQGAKIKLSGRINGAEISRREALASKKLPLQTLRADIDYGEAAAFNTYGTVGVKVWIYKGEVFEKENH